VRLLSLALVLLLSACASLAPPPTLPQLRVAPADFGAPLQLAQRLTVQEAPQDPLLPTSERQLDTVLQLDAGRLRLVALALGQRVLTLGWDGQQLEQQRHPLLPASVDAERVLRDIALVFAPLDALRALLGEGWTLVEQGSERRLAHAGQVLLVVHYRQGRRHVEIDNRAERYRLRIESQSQDGQEIN
jgi:hypothetical protein